MSGRLWGVLGRLWGVLGRLWGVLGRAWGAQGISFGSPWLPLGSILASFWWPWALIWPPLGRGPKMSSKFLDFGVHFGSILRPKLIKKNALFFPWKFHRYFTRFSQYCVIVFLWFLACFLIEVCRLTRKPDPANLLRILEWIEGHGLHNLSEKHQKIKQRIDSNFIGK